MFLANHLLHGVAIITEIAALFAIVSVFLIYYVIIPIATLFTFLPATQSLCDLMMRCLKSRKRCRRYKAKWKSSGRIYCRRKCGAIVMLKRRVKSIMAIAAYMSTQAVALRTMANQFAPRDMDHSYDTDSYLLGIDNHASYCMTPNINDFISPPKPSRTKIKGIAGYLTSTRVGTVKWSWEDDGGSVHHFLIPNCYLIPNLPIRLLSPQHLGQILEPLEETEEGTYEKTTGC